MLKKILSPLVNEGKNKVFGRKSLKYFRAYQIKIPTRSYLRVSAMR